jgi:hypothetical protein
MVSHIDYQIFGNGDPLFVADRTDVVLIDLSRE